LFAAILLYAPLLSLGATAADYRSRLDAAQKDVDAIVSALQNKKQPDDDDWDLIRQAVARVRKAVPAIESIDVNGTSIETQNGWLGSELDKFDKETNTADEIKILLGVSERLSSIQERVSELENVAAATRTKDEDKQKLNEILSRGEYQKPEDKGESAFQRWMRWFVEWLRSLFPDSPELPNVDPKGFQPLSVVIQVLVYAMVIGLVGFLIYKFAPVIVERFSKKQKKEKTGRVILGEHIDASRLASDLFAEAENFARQGDLRGAIRKGYVALLCDLADRKVIGLARHKTNRDYLRDVRKRGPLYEPMNRATGSFERHWYGFGTPDKNDWEEFQEQYRSALNKVG
jgi:hypothetical protein